MRLTKSLAKDIAKILSKSFAGDAGKLIYALSGWNGTRVTANGAAIKDGKACVKSVRGKSIKVNQIALTTFTETTASGVTLSCVDGVWTLNGTCTGSALVVADPISVLASHKYMIVYEHVSGSQTIVSGPASALIQAYGANILTVSVNNRESASESAFMLGTSSAAGECTFRVRVENTNVYNQFKFRAFLFDLTAMGIDSFTTADQVAQYLGYKDAASLPYVPHQASTTVVNATHTSLVSKDTNAQVIDTLQLGWDSTIFPNGGCGVGTAYDEYFPATGKAIKRINKKVFDGTENWSSIPMSGGAGNYYQVSLGDIGMCPYASATFGKDQICNLYNIKNPYTDKNSAWFYCSPSYVTEARFQDDAYADVAAWKAHLAQLYAGGNPLMMIYELRTPTEHAITPLRSKYKVANQGTETVVSTNFSAPFIAEIGYTPKPWKGLTFKSSGTSAFYLENNGTNNPNCEYSTDLLSWNPAPTTSATAVSFEKLYLRGVNASGFSVSAANYSRIVLGGNNVDASGSVMSLLDGVGESLTIPSGSNYCFRRLFFGNTVLKTAPSVPATSLAMACYQAMFQACSNLTSAPVLPATTLATYCYNYMFSTCTSLQVAPELLAMSVPNSAYSQMFQSCSGLATVPELPALNVGNSSYQAMFQGCTGISEVPILQATTIGSSCYLAMFKGCTNLEVVHGISALTLSSYSCQEMFNGCTNLNEVHCDATDISATNCTLNWLSGVAESGDFYGKTAAGWTEGSASGIPSGWIAHLD